MMDHNTAQGRSFLPMVRTDIEYHPHSHDVFLNKRGQCAPKEQKMKTPMIIAAAFATTLYAGSLSAQSSLAGESEITEGLISVGQAIEISDKCPSISARTIRGAFFLNSLQNRAFSLGYTNAQVDAYIDNRSEQDRLEGIARARLVRMGVVPGQEATYCTVGRSEIAAASQVGRLLK
jgi:hypothetical protein